MATTDGHQNTRNGQGREESTSPAITATHDHIAALKTYLRRKNANAGNTRKYPSRPQTTTSQHTAPASSHIPPVRVERSPCLTMEPPRGREPLLVSRGVSHAPIFFGVQWLGSLPPRPQCVSKPRNGRTAANAAVLSKTVMFHGELRPPTVPFARGAALESGTNSCASPQKAERSP